MKKQPIFRTVWLKNSTDQYVVTIPHGKGINPGDVVRITKVIR